MNDNNDIFGDITSSQQHEADQQLIAEGTMLWDDDANYAKSHLQADDSHDPGAILALIIGGGIVFGPFFALCWQPILRFCGTVATAVAGVVAFFM